MGYDARRLNYIGPFEVTFDGTDLGGEELADLPAGCLLIEAWAEILTPFVSAGATEMTLTIAVGDAGENANVAAVFADFNDSPDYAIGSALPSGATVVQLRNALSRKFRIVEDTHLVVFVDTDGDAFTAGVAHVYALIASPDDTP